MNIEPRYVDFSTAKLLKEKGFEIDDTTFMSFYRNGKENNIGFDTGSLPDSYSEEFFNPHIDLLKPEQHQVVEWLTLNHGIWVSIDWMSRVKPYESGYYCHLRGITKKLNQDNFIVINDTLNPGYEVFNSPQEAYSAAFDYILKELI
jgi:hypothetical protein